MNVDCALLANISCREGRRFPFAVCSANFSSDCKGIFKFLNIACKPLLGLLVAYLSRYRQAFLLGRAL